jgi:Aldehyde dehydrogenase family
MTVAHTSTASSHQDWSQLRQDPYPLLIDGELVVPPDRATLDVVYPFTNQPVARVYAGGPAEVDRAVAAARAAVDGEWGHTTPAERQTILQSGLHQRQPDSVRNAKLSSMF